MNEPMHISFSPPTIEQSDIDAVTAVLKSGWITSGQIAKDFETEISQLCQTKRTVVLNSCTAALETIFRLIDIKPGDEVIVPAYTFTATASSAIHCGANIVMVDTLSNSLLMDPAKLETAISSKTKAIVTVDLAGIPCDNVVIDQVIAAKQSAFTPRAGTLQESFGRIIHISDAAHSIGATLNGVPTGQLADFTAFSFHAVKNITTAEGGALTWRSNEAIDDDLLYNTIQQMSLHGQSKSASDKLKAGNWEYNITAPSYKNNMADLNAALGLSQIRRIQKLSDLRNNLLKHYQSKLSSLPIIWTDHFATGVKSSAHLAILEVEGITLEQRNHIIDVLAQRGIAANVHYKPLPLLTAYKNLGFDIADFPNANNHFEREITLPLYAHMSEAEQDYVCEDFIDIVGNTIGN